MFAACAGGVPGALGGGVGGACAGVLELEGRVAGVVGVVVGRVEGGGRGGFRGGGGEGDGVYTGRAEVAVGVLAAKDVGFVADDGDGVVEPGESLAGRVLKEGRRGRVRG